MYVQGYKTNTRVNNMNQIVDHINNELMTMATRNINTSINKRQCHTQTQDMITQFGPSVLRLRSPLPGRNPLSTGFSTFTRITFTPHSVGFQRSPNNVHSSHSVSSSPKTSLHTRFLAHRKPYNTHNVTNINLFSTIDENTMKAQLKVIISHHPTILCM